MIVYRFNRPNVERGDLRQFLALYGPDSLPKGAPLLELMDCFMFSVKGWDDDPREIHLIPEIRRFFSAFHEAWPYWLYFCNMDVENFLSMIACCLRSVKTIEIDGSDKLAAAFDKAEVVNFLKADSGPMSEMCERAGLSERGIYDRTKAIYQFWGLPFDAEPPSIDQMRPAWRDVGPNDPCPCGSGKKFKRCCGRG